MLPHFKHIVNPKLKYIYLHFESDGTLVVKSPRVSTSQIEKILLTKSDWIANARQKLKKKKSQPLQLDSNDQIYYLGESFSVVYNQIPNKKTSLQFNSNRGFLIEYDTQDINDIEQCVEKFYLNEAKNMIPKLVQAHAQKMQLHPSAIILRKAKKQWGSCSSKNRLSLNFLMMKLPLNVIQYIIIHELAHIKHKNHKQEFWQFVAQYESTYKSLRQELKQWHL